MSGPAAATGLRHPSPVLLAGAAVTAQVFYPLVYGSARDLLTIASVVAFCAASVAHATLTRGRRVGVALLSVFGAGGLGIEAVGLATAVPFGEYSYGDRLGPALLGVPVVIGLAWTMMAWPSWIVAGRLTAGRWRRIGLAAWGLASWDLFLDPQMVDAGNWRWAHPSPSLPGVYGVPLTNHLGWLAVALVLMTVFHRVAPQSAESVPVQLDTVPVALFGWVYISSLVGLSVFFRLPAAALWGTLGMGVLAVPLLLGVGRNRRVR